LAGDEQATGYERIEIEATKAGIDLFDRKTLEGPFGTADAPVVVSSNLSNRIVGCVGV
jgi:hypothetical protein